MLSTELRLVLSLVLWLWLIDTDPLKLLLTLSEWFVFTDVLVDWLVTFELLSLLLVLSLTLALFDPEPDTEALVLDDIEAENDADAEML